MAAPERRYTGDSRVNYRKEDRKRERGGGERERERSSRRTKFGGWTPLRRATRAGGGRRRRRNISFHPLSSLFPRPSHSVAHCPISDAHIIAAAKESLERNFKVRRLVWRPASAHVTNYLFCQACAQPSPREAGAATAATTHPRPSPSPQPAADPLDFRKRLTPRLAWITIRPRGDGRACVPPASRPYTEISSLSLPVPTSWHDTLARPLAKRLTPGFH